MTIDWRHRILITGANGQLGRALQMELATSGIVNAWQAGGPNNYLILYAQHERRFRQNVARPLDITARDAVDRAVQRDKPDIVIHAAAWTDSLGCEKNPARAMEVNGEGTANVSRAAASIGATMLYVSSNEVFDGEKGAPYDEDDEPHPVNAYGRSKLAGEEAVREAGGKYYIVRTSWVYGPGRASYPEKIVKAAKERGRLQVVTDETASPTWTFDLARAIARLIEKPDYGVYHLAGAGEASRKEWVEEILRLAKIDVPIEAITLAENGVEVTRPRYTALANTRAAKLGIMLRPWRRALLDHFRSVVRSN